MRSRYWSNSALADWIRGTAKPKAATGKGWREWEATAQKEHPIRYWIVEEAFDAVQNFLWWPIDQIYNVKYYINNRWITGSNRLTAHPRDIKPGQWQDVGYRFLPCLFNELVNFVEIETAWSHIAWDSEARKKYKSPFWASGWFRWRTWRSPEAGLDHLDWASKLEDDDGEPTLQAASAKEIKELYIWWTTVYPNRPDPMEVSGWSAYCDEGRNAGLSMFDREETPAEKKQVKKMLDAMRKLEAQYEREDEQMLIRLIKIRNSLWT